MYNFKIYFVKCITAPMEVAYVNKKTNPSEKYT